MTDFVNVRVHLYAYVTSIYQSSFAQITIIHESHKSSRAKLYMNNDAKLAAVLNLQKTKNHENQFIYVDRGKNSFSIV